jgi:hypothetical protein
LHRINRIINKGKYPILKNKPFPNVSFENIYRTGYNRKFKRDSLIGNIKSEDGIKCRGDFFWSVVDFSFEKDTIEHIFTGQYYGLHIQCM